MLAASADATPEGDRWLHEVKLDGYRLLCELDAGRVRLLTRGGHDWTDRFPAIVAALKKLPVERALLDGEAVVLDTRGISDFQALQNAIKQNPRRSMLFAFDLLHLDGYDLRKASLLDRKTLLVELLQDEPGRGALRLLTHLRGGGERVKQQACELGLEGILSKRVDGSYEFGRRSPAWIKSRCLETRRFAIVGFTAGQGSRVGLGALLLAEPGEGNALRFAGKVGTGFDEAMLLDLRDQLDSLARPAPPADLERIPKMAGVRWVEPALHAEVAYTERTTDGHLRHPVFHGLAEQREADRADTSSGGKIMPAPANRVAGVALSNPDKVYYPEANLTKRDLAVYYEAVAAWALPHLAGRPLVLLRCPEGLSGACFYQKDQSTALPPGLATVTIEHSDGPNAYAMVGDVQGLVALAQLGALEVHPWGARADRTDRPDRMVIDLDPGPGVAWSRVVKAAHVVRELLEMVGLVSFARTTGGKGLHVVVPLERRHGWAEVKQFAGAIASTLAGAAPGSYTAEVSKARREGRIYVDYLRNSRGATAIGTYCTRARPGAPVAMPVAWDAINDRLDPAGFTLSTVPVYLADRASDPWAQMPELRQRLTTAMRRKLGIDAPPKET